MKPSVLSNRASATGLRSPALMSHLKVLFSQFFLHYFPDALNFLFGLGEKLPSPGSPPPALDGFFQVSHPFINQDTGHIQKATLAIN